MGLVELGSFKSGALLRLHLFKVLADFVCRRLLQGEVEGALECALGGVEFTALGPHPAERVQKCRIIGRR